VRTLLKLLPAGVFAILALCMAGGPVAAQRGGPVIAQRGGPVIAQRGGPVIAQRGGPAIPQRGGPQWSAGTIEPVAMPIAVADPMVERLRTDVSITVDGAQRVARVEVEEEFRNNAHRLMEGDYLYPIPAGAVFTEFSLFMGEQELKGEMLPADRARGIYEEIVRRKKDPALIELVGHGLLRARVFPIAPGETRRIILRYTQLLGRDGHLVRLRYPRVVGMFDGGEEPAPRPLTGRPRIEAQATSAGSGAAAPFSLTIDVTGAGRFATPYSPTHAIEVREPREGELRISYGDRDAAPRDFELFLPLREDAVGASVVTHAPDGEPGFYMMVISPPSVVETVEIPRDLTLVLDVSGSMAGDKIVQARAALDQMLANLSAADRFRVIAFSSAVRQYRNGWSDASPEELRAARDWLAGVPADGSTNIEAALQEALRPAASAGRLAQVVFLTDGRPTVGETAVERIVGSAQALLDDERLFAFGVGHDVNTFLLDSLAERGHGTVGYVAPGTDVEEAVSSLTRKITRPALTDLRIVEAPVMLEDSYPQELPDLFFGEDLVLFGRYRGDGGGELLLEGSRAGRTERLRFAVEFARREPGNAFIPKLWASRKAGALTAQVRLHGANPELVEEIRQLGLRYGILTEYTAYLVEEPGMTLDDATLQEVMERARRLEVAADAQVGAVAFRRADRDQKAQRVDSVQAAEAAQASYAQSPATVTGASPIVDGRADGPAGREGDEALEGASRHVVDRLFVMRAGVWTDLRFGTQRLVAVEPYSDAYFQLLARIPGLKPFLALGERVIIAGDGIAVALAAGGASEWSAGELEAVAGAFGS
jgi:Ca-activated chloride channel family protein